MFDVITIGSAVRDVFARTGDIQTIDNKKFVAGEAACFALGSKLNLDDVQFSVGGGAINTAVTFANQGFKTAVISLVGKDPEGMHIKDKALAYGIHCDFLAEDKNYTTSFSFVLSLLDGSRSVFRYKGASWHLQDKHIPWTEFRAKWLYINHMAGESAHVLPKLLEQAKSKGIQIAWNPGSTQLENPQELQKLMGYADLFIVNQEEASQIVDIPFQKKKQIFKKLDQLVQGKVIMTKGKKGVDISNGKTLWSAGVLSLDKAEIIDRTGAGDAFGSGFVAALMKKPSDMEHAIQFASANATGVLTKWGANHGLLSKTDLPTKYGKLQIKKLIL